MQIKVTSRKFVHQHRLIEKDNHISGYQSNNQYFGATIGRVANRIGKGTFVVDNKRYNVTKNAGEHSLHGGIHGWSFKVWNATISEDDDCVVMTLDSPDDDEGYPGKVTATVSFQLSDEGELRIKMKATSTKATPINLTNHSYFNLAGHVRNTFLPDLVQEVFVSSRKKEITKHPLLMNVDRFEIFEWRIITPL